MMDRDVIFQTLQNAKPELSRRGVQSIAVFGSIARGGFSADSDLDILVEFAKPVGLFEFVRLKLFLEQITHRRVDLVTPDALRPEMKQHILEEAIGIG